MALDLTQDQKDKGKRNFEQATGDLTRRGFMKSMVAGAAVVPVSAAVYFGYETWKTGKPVRTALIGGGDEGGVLVGDHNPEFMEIVADADVRPYNLDRIFKGEPSGPRKGLNKIYGEATAKKIEKFGHYKDVLQSDVIRRLGLEAVIIALPLHLHAEAAIEAMKAGLHVLCEKLMARSIPLCKDMIRTSKETNRFLSIGHQRHYSMLYAHALEVVESGALGEMRYIDALWHRNFTWPWSASQAKEPLAVGVRQPDIRDGWYPPIYQRDFADLNDVGKLKHYGYTSLEELIRWRVFDRTGGGLMAELGSHQLDASSIFLGKVKPIAVSGVGGRFFFGDWNKVKENKPTGPNPREGDDHVFVTFEFPGQSYWKKDSKGKPVVENNAWVVDNADDVVVVTYSSISTNGFEKYGECLKGSRGTMIVEEEREIYLFKENDPGKANSGGRDTAVAVTAAGGGKPALEASSTWGGAGASAVVKAAGASPTWDTPVRGYRTEMEHFAFCVRELGKDGQVYEKDADGEYARMKAKRMPKCHGEVAMADAILALTANMAMDKRQRIAFEPNWFLGDKTDVPETKYGKQS
jgi:predicted dehydrogenase